MTNTILAPTRLGSASADNQLATIDRARSYADASRSNATHRAYEGGWKDFAGYCTATGLESLPASPQTVVLYVTNLAQRAKYATIKQRLVAISQYHTERGLASPTAHEIVRRVVWGIARTNGTAQTKKAAITLDELRRMLLAIRGRDIKATRDRALLLLGFAGALRRSELASLDVADLAWSRSGLKITIRRSKTDQCGEGAEIAIPFISDEALCAARAVKLWLIESVIADGPLFRTFTLGRDITDRRIDGRDVANLIKTLASRARLEGDFSGHSLRAGFCTSAAQAHVGLDRIALVTRHRSLTVLAGYVRRANLFDDPVLLSIIENKQNAPLHE